MGALVTMCKGVDTLDVHPSCVAAHALQGWQPAPERQHSDEQEPPADKPATANRKARRESAPAPTEQTD